MDPAVGEYIPVAPVDDDAKKHNQNLPGMGGVYNSFNLQLYHYAGNNPVKYTDPDGNEMYISPKLMQWFADFFANKESNSRQIVNIKMNFNKSDELLKVCFTYNNNKTVNFFIRLTNNVRTPEQRKNVPVLFNGYYYFPEDFPNGEWNIIAAGINNKNSDIGPYLRTDAGRMVDTYQKKEDGTYEKTGKQEYDIGYCFHGSDGEGTTSGDNNENYPTWGCGRGKNEDIVKLIEPVNKALQAGAKVTVKVED